MTDKLYRLRVKPQDDLSDGVIIHIETNKSGLSVDRHGFPTLASIEAWHEKNNPHLFLDRRTQAQRLNDGIAEVIHKTDLEDRQAVALQFLTSETDGSWRRMVNRGIDPVALFVSALIDMDCDLVVYGSRLVHGDLLGCAVFVQSYRPQFFTDIHPCKLYKPVGKSSKTVDKSSKPVDNLAKSVDKSVDNPVDKTGTYPQAYPAIALPVDNFAKLSTLDKSYPHAHVGNF